MLGSTRKKSDPQIVYTVTSDATGPGYSFPANALMTITPPVPPRLLPHIARVDGQVLPGERVLEIDGSTFELHVAAEERRQSQPAPTPDRTLDRNEIVRELFRGDESQFEAADVVAFPRASGRRVDSRRIVATWRRRDLRSVA